jgi:hypothetical protein
MVNKSRRKVLFFLYNWMRISMSLTKRSSLSIHKYDSQYRVIKNSPGIGGPLIFTW